MCVYGHVHHNVHIRELLTGVNLLPSRDETQVTGFNDKHPYPLSHHLYYPKVIHARQGFE